MDYNQNNVIDVFIDALNYMPWLKFAVLFFTTATIVYFCFNLTNFACMVKRIFFIKYFTTVFNKTQSLIVHA